ncbi:MAG: hypothetical protein P8M77_09555 [Porticoccaceae bacterium]|nr:hypothetical protein [Porticoccaceae bacterium]
MKKMILGIILLSFSLALAAEHISLPIGQQTRSYELSLPDRSMTKKAVEEAFGDPSKIKDPVGEPPITAWEYKDFVVYFEQNWVLHAVVRHPNNNSTSE